LGVHSKTLKVRYVIVILHLISILLIILTIIRMAARRAHTEGIMGEDEDNMPIDLNNLKDEELQALAQALEA
jgi:hypothetical protein